jgi:hypothetical protein
MATKFNFSLDQGADQTVEVTYAPSNVPFDLTGWAVKAQLRKTKSSTDVALELKTSDSTITVGGSVILLPFTASQLAALSGSYSYDIFASNGSLRRKIAEGIISINAPVTHPVP